MPAKVVSVALYLLSCIQNGATYAVLKMTFYGIKYIHNLHMLVDPTGNALAVNLLEVAKRLNSQSVRKKEPLTI